MEPIINIQENIGKTVGKRRGIRDPFIPGSTKKQMKDWKAAFGTPYLPKGVFRFKTHEEADEWTLKMLTRFRRS